MDKNNLEKIKKLRHELHRNAELSGQEYQTKKILMKFMKEETDFEVVDRGAWFYCRKYPGVKKAGSDLYSNSSPGAMQPEAVTNGLGESLHEHHMAPIAFRADMDALPIDETIKLKEQKKDKCNLRDPGSSSYAGSGSFAGGSYASVTPGVSHKCGHDGHSASLAGVGLELTGRELSRPVILIFQHAEETGKGGQVCAQLIPELGISEVYAFHNLSGYPEGSIVVRKGLSQPASKGLTVYFHGKTSHASNPEEGSNPSGAVADLVNCIRKLLQEPHKGMVLCTVVNINVGTRDFGVSAGEGEISVTLRAEYESEMNDMESDILKAADKLAARDGLRTEHTEADPFPETKNNEDALNKVVSLADSLGDTVIYMQKLWRASEDFGCYLKMCPGAIFYVGNGVDYPPLHTCRYDFNDNILERPIDLFCALADART